MNFNRNFLVNNNKLNTQNGKIYFKDHDDKRKQLFDLVKLKY